MMKNDSPHWDPRIMVAMVAAGGLRSTCEETEGALMPADGRGDTGGEDNEGFTVLMSSTSGCRIESSAISSLFIPIEWLPTTR
jgi:hypothetical protein